MKLKTDKKPMMVYCKPEKVLTADVPLKIQNESFEAHAL